MKYKNIKLGEVAEITMGQSPKSTYYNKEGMGIPFIQGVSTFEDNYPKIETYTTKYNKEAQKGDLLFSVRAPVGRINVANQTIAIGRGLASLKVKKGYSKSYIYYLFKKIGNQLDSIGSGTVFSSINKKELINLKIRVPEKLHDQCKIADRLRKIDEEIEINNQINDNLLELLDTRFKQFISSSKLTDTTLHNIAIIHSGGNKPKKFSKVKTNEYSVPVYSNGVSKKGLFGFTNKAKVNERAVTVSARGTIGFTVLHNKPFVPIVRLVYLTYKSVPINFLYLLVRSLNIQGYGSTQQQITVPYLRKLKIKIPDANEINKFDAENLSLFDLIWIKEKENILLFKIKENLLEKYF